MGLLNIYVYPDAVLKKRSVEIGNIDQRIRELVNKMTQTMYAAPGIGLAAPQVGISSCLVLVDRSLGKGREPLAMINPKIIAAEGESVREEGCLSLPETYGQVKRAQRVEVEYIDLNGQIKRMLGEDLLARVFQHEIDHLNGVVFIDRMSRLRRDFLKRRYLKRYQKQKV